MTKPSEKLAQSLKIMSKYQNEYGIAVIKSSDISRTHRDRLVSRGFLKEILKGWYYSTSPDEVDGDSTSWFTSYWHFISVYSKERFGKQWTLSPEQSLIIHSGNYSVPVQILIRSPKAGNNRIALLHNTSLIDVTSSIPGKKEIVEKDGLNLFSLHSALIACSPNFFQQHPTEARIALSMVKDATSLLYQLLEGGNSTIAGRLTGAFRSIGSGAIADEILSVFRSADYEIRENNPFTEKDSVILDTREISPYVNRVRLMWQKLREYVSGTFPNEPGIPGNHKEYFNSIDDIFVSDAYHSLSIEGYRVAPELIEKVRTGDWNPAENEEDKKQINAMAARGYWQAFKTVKQSIKKILEGDDPGEVVENDHRIWYRELFSTSVTAGILKLSDLAGYRNGPVYIKGSRHVPPGPPAVRDLMPAMFDLLKEEQEASVRAVLGHFFFVYIHPYMDGNGRIGRFLMNTMLASGGYTWLIIPIERRSEYMAALEKASVEQDISDFTDFLLSVSGTDLNQG